MQALHVLVVDDEPLARRALVQALAAYPEVAQVSESEDGHAAIDSLRTQSIDLVFLDVRMPEIDGFEVVAQVGLDALPPVVFVTAFDRFAVRAFEVRALDYLLKPFDEARFDKAFRRALEAVAARAAGAATAGLDAAAAASFPNSPTGRLSIRNGGRTTRVPYEDIVWIEAASSYVRVHTQERTHLLRGALGALEERLGAAGFLRVHRSAMVHLAAVVELRHLIRGDYELLMSNGDKVRASRRRRAELLAGLDAD